MTNDQQLSIRLEQGVADRAEALLIEMADLPAFRALRLSRAAVLRMAMLEGLQVLEKRYSGMTRIASRKRDGRR
jgi:hypothetical protein